MTFKEISVEYFKSWGLSVRKRTKQAHKKSFLYQSEELLDLDIKEINKEIIENHLAKMLSRLSQSTAAHWNAKCKNILEYAFKNNYIDSDFYKNIIHIKVKQTYSINIITENQFKMLLTIAKTQTRHKDLDEKILFLELLFKTGLRHSEAKALQIYKINFDINEIRVNNSLYSDVKGKWELAPTKTPCSNRIIKIDKNLAQKLKDFIELKSKNRDDFLFAYADGSPRTTVFAKDLLKKSANLLGVKISAHGLRHSHATMLIRNLVPVQLVQKRMGHADPTTTIKTYTHLVSEDEKIIVDLLEKI